jgi:MSHA biogenesis protein MshQ
MMRGLAALCLCALLALLAGGASAESPNEPTADLVISLTRNGELQVGRTTTYTLTASNAGPRTASGLIFVTATLSSSLKYVSVTGRDWSCGVLFHWISCVALGPLNTGESLPPITLTVETLSAGASTVSAWVAGLLLFENVVSNNYAEDTSTAVALRTTSYEFTIGSCKPNIAIGAAGQCQAFPGAVHAGKAIKQLFVTKVSDTGIPMSLSTTAATVVPLRFWLSCELPAKGAGTPAFYGGLELPACADAGEFWSGAQLPSFAANSPSARLGDGIFRYDDVGKIRLNLIDDASKTGSATLVSTPVSIEFLIKRNGDGVPNPAVNYEDAQDAPGFVRAGEAFTLRIGARTETGRFAPNFGGEGLQVGVEQIANGNQARLKGSFTLVNGFWQGDDFYWDDVGALEIRPILLPKNDYLGTGPVALIAQKVGRFYPAYLKTTTEPNFSCLPAMGCPAGISGAAYSWQPFKVHIAAFSLKDSELANYRGKLARNVTLGAFDKPGSTTENPGDGKLDPKYLAVDANMGAPVLETVYRLPVRFSAAVPRAAWGAPATIYLRASTIETVAGKDSIDPVTISSKRDPSIAAESGMWIVNGRLQLATAVGSELLRLPVPMNAQYWSGKAWANNSADNKSEISFFIDYTSCARKLALAARMGSDNCDLELLKAQGAGALLKDGAGKLWLGAPGVGNVGSAWIKVKDNFPPWLPSTRARAVFGVHKSPLIYLREVY